jgi:hypothetical protein
MGFLMLPGSLPFKVTVPDPWVILQGGGAPSFCGTGAAAVHCAVVSPPQPVLIMTTDANAPARNITIDTGLQVACP